MPNNPRSERRDHDLVTDTTVEIQEEVDQERLAPHYANANRDRARGDRDRTRRREDVGRSRS
jgi:hypothetical protein